MAGTRTAPSSRVLQKVLHRGGDWTGSRDELRLPARRVVCATLDASRGVEIAFTRSNLTLSSLQRCPDAKAMTTSKCIILFKRTGILQALSVDSTASLIIW